MYYLSTFDVTPIATRQYHFSKRKPLTFCTQCAFYQDYRSVTAFLRTFFFHRNSLLHTLFSCIALNDLQIRSFYLIPDKGHILYLQIVSNREKYSNNLSLGTLARCKYGCHRVALFHCDD